MTPNQHSELLRRFADGKATDVVELRDAVAGLLEQLEALRDRANEARLALKASGVRPDLVDDLNAWRIDYPPATLDELFVPSGVGPAEEWYCRCWNYLRHHVLRPASTRHCDECGMTAPWAASSPASEPDA